MDRPSNGHRRHDTGSITVVDLIRRQQGPVRIPSADEAATVQFMNDLLGATDESPDQVEHPRGWLAKGAKLAGLALGSLALCGSVYAASTLTQHRPHATATNADITVLTGVGALRPDTVAAQLSSGVPTGGPTTGAVPTRASIATGRATGTVVGHAAPPATATPQRHAALPPAADLVSAADVVRAFYQLVATDPSLATQLLSPALLSTDNSGFDNAWNSMSKIEIESVRQTSDHTAEAVVRMLEPDGTWLRVVELVHVTDSDKPLINGAELLSAQRG